MQTLLQESAPMMLGKNGKFEPMKKTPLLKRGQTIIAEGAYMYAAYYVITDPNTRRCVLMGEDVQSIEDLPSGYFSSPVEHYDEYTRPFSELFGIGFYYDDTEQFPIVPEEEIVRLEKRVQDIEHFTQIKKELNEKAQQEDVARLRKEYGSILTEVTDKWSKDRRTATMNNVRALLRNNFPGIKFSVRRENCDTLYVSWTDGPTEDKVKKIVDMFRGKYFNVMEDIVEYIHSNFSNLYGSMGYIFTSRNISYDLKSQMSNQIRKWFSVLNDENTRYDACELYNSGLKNDIPENIKDIISDYHGKQYLSQWAEYICLKTDYTPIRDHKEDTQPTIVEPIAGNFEIIDYSEKAIAVTGDTKSVKDKLKALGGRFNPRLSCGAGWIFPKTKEAALRAVLA